MRILVCLSWNWAFVVEPGLTFPSCWAAVADPLPHPPLLGRVAAMSNTLKRFCWRVFPSHPVRSKPLCAAVEHVIMRVLPVHYFSAERERLSVLFCLSLSGWLSAPWVSWHLVYFLPWVIIPRTVPLPWFYSLFHTCSAIFSCISNRNQLTQRRFGHVMFGFILVASL